MCSGLALSNVSLRDDVETAPEPFKVPLEAPILAPGPFEGPRKAEVVASAGRHELLQRALKSLAALPGSRHQVT